MRRLTGDQQLLIAYLDDKSEGAFARLVERHMKLVYWTCRRDLGDVQLAEDATQAVFVLFAQKANSLRQRSGISQWLFYAARLVSKNAKRSERLRRAAMQEAIQAMVLTSSSEDRWPEIEPQINDALSKLASSDREAILLRYFDGFSLREVAEEIGTTESSAAKRIERAVEKVRRILNAKDVAVTSAVLAALLIEHPAHAVPESCHDTTIAALHQLGIGASSAAAGSKIALLNKGVFFTMQVIRFKTVIAAVAVVAMAAGVANVTAAKHNISTNNLTVMGTYVAPVVIIPNIATPIIAAPAIVHPAIARPAPAHASILNSTIKMPGWVTTPDGKPVTDATVTLELCEDPSEQVTVLQTAKPDSKGFFVMTLPHSAPQGSFGMTVLKSVPGVRTVYGVKGLFEITLPKSVPGLRRTVYGLPLLFATSPNGMGIAASTPHTGSAPTTTITLEPFTTVRVHFQDEDGKPVPNVKIVPLRLLYQGAALLLSKTTTPQWVKATGADGTAELTGLPQGYTLSFDIDDHFMPPENNGQIALAGAATTPDQTFHITRACSISGTAQYGPSKAPAAGVLLEAFPLLYNESQSGSAVTDAAGKYQFQRLVPGTYSIQIARSGMGGSTVNDHWTAVARSVTVPAATDVTDVDLTLISGGMLAGTVLDKNTGKPLAGMTVAINGPAHPPVTPDSDISETGPDGRYRFRVAPGQQKLQVFVNMSSFSLSQHVQIAEGEVRNLVIRTSGPDTDNGEPVHGVVFGQGGNPVAGAEVVATSQDPIDEATTTTDRNGRFAFDRPGLPPKALLFAHFGDLFTTGTPVNSTGDSLLRLSSRVSSSFQGLVTGDDGTPIANATVRLIRTQPDDANNLTGTPTVIFTTVTSGEGQYKFGPSYSGFVYVAQVIAPGYGVKSTDDITGVPGRLIEFQNVTLEKTDSFVGGTVVDPKGNPIEGVTVSDADMKRQTVTDSNGRFHLTGVPRKSTMVYATAGDGSSFGYLVSSGSDGNVVKVENRN